MDSSSAIYQLSSPPHTHALAHTQTGHCLLSRLSGDNRHEIKYTYHLHSFYICRHNTGWLKWCHIHACTYVHTYIWLVAVWVWHDYCVSDDSVKRHDRESDSSQPWPECLPHETQLWVGEETRYIQQGRQSLKVTRVTILSYSQRTTRWQWTPSSSNASDSICMRMAFKPSTYMYIFLHVWEGHDWKEEDLQKTLRSQYSAYICLFQEPQADSKSYSSTHSTCTIYMVSSHFTMPYQKKYYT